MNIRFKRGNEYVTYTDDDLSKLSKEQIKVLKGELQSNIEMVSARRAKYNAENDDGYGSKEYFSKIAQYKSVTARLRSYINYLNRIQKDCEKDDLKDREHWLWCFYHNVKDFVNKKTFEKIINLTDEKAEFHVEIGEPR